jgi:small GTP-binding protein
MAETRGIKIVFVGDSGCGKTALINRKANGEFSDRLSPTIAAAFVKISLTWNGEPLKVSVWDTAGQEVYRSVAPMYYRGAHCAVVTFDLTNESSFDQVQGWISEIRGVIDKAIFILCGNKVDLEKDREVTFARASELARRLDIPYVETSAYTEKGIDALFDTIVERVKEIHPEALKQSRSLEQMATGGGGCC